MAKRLCALGALVFAASVVACGGDDSTDPAALPPGAAGNPGDPNNPITIGPDGVPVDKDGNPIDPKIDGKYELSNTFDLTSAGVFPDIANDTLKALSNFKEQPSQTIVDLLDAANVPVVPDVINAIPGPIRGFVLGYIDDAIFKSLYKAVPVTKQITVLLDDLATIATKFELVTTLDLPLGDAIGDTRARHTISGVAWKWDDKRHVINAPELVSKLVEQPVQANAVLLEKRSSELESGRLQLEDHKFSVPIGTFAVYAADKLAQDKFGAKDLRGAIGMVVDCKAIAKNVADRCIDPIGPGKVCVGHEKELENLCTVGLNVLVGVITGEIKKLDLPVVNFKEGTAQMWDAETEGGPLDAVISRIDKGYWTATVNAGKEEKPILATFTGRRVGESTAPASPGPNPN